MRSRMGAVTHRSSAHNRDKTHCPRGHPLEGDNLEPSALRLRGVRNCNTCHAGQARQSAARQREAIGQARDLLGLSWDKYIYAFGWSRKRADEIIEVFNREVAQ